MNTGTTETEDKLEFNEIKSGRHTAYGVLTDKDGNTFSVEVKGTNKADVEKFINYELKQAKNGEGITTNIVALTAKEQKALAKGKSTNTALPEDDEVYEQTSWRGICIKIRLLALKNQTDKPSKIRLTIDPPIESGKTMDFPLEHQRDANVKCSVSIGKVSMELFEFTNLTKTTSITRGRQTAFPGNPAEFNVPQVRSEGMADWNIKVSGDTTSTFTLTFDLFVM